MPYLTGDSLTADYLCRCIKIPNELWAVMAVNGALLELAELYNWETFGTVTAGEASDRFWSVWQEYQQSMCIAPGTVTAFAGATIPPQSLLCDGNSYATADYPKLFDAIGYTYGGSGADFNVPDLRGRTILGVGHGTGLSDYSLADTGGEETHVLIVDELASHAHFAEPHSHTYSSAENVEPVIAPGEAPTAIGVPLLTGASGVTIDPTGGDDPHENRQPYMALNYIIQAL